MKQEEAKAQVIKSGWTETTFNGVTYLVWGAEKVPWVYPKGHTLTNPEREWVESWSKVKLKEP